jgi:hypothetical protein
MTTKVESLKRHPPGNWQQILERQSMEPELRDLKPAAVAILKARFKETEKINLIDGTVIEPVEVKKEDVGREEGFLVRTPEREKVLVFDSEGKNLQKVGSELQGVKLKQFSNKGGKR